MSKTALEVAGEKLVEIYYDAIDTDLASGVHKYSCDEILTRLKNLSFTHNNRKCGVGVYYEDGELPALLISDDAACNIECHKRERFNLLKANFKQVLKEDE